MFESRQMQKHLYCLVFTKTVLSKLLETVFICGKLGELKPDLTTTAHFAIQLKPKMQLMPVKMLRLYHYCCRKCKHPL